MGIRLSLRMQRIQARSWLACLFLLVPQIAAAGPCEQNPNSDACRELMRTRAGNDAVAKTRSLGAGSIDRTLTDAPCTAASCRGAVRTAGVAGEQADRVAETARRQLDAARARERGYVDRGIGLLSQDRPDTSGTASSRPSMADARRFIRGSSPRENLSPEQIDQLAEEMQHEQLRGLMEAIRETRKAQRDFATVVEENQQISQAARDRVRTLTGREARIGALDPGSRNLSSAGHRKGATISERSESGQSRPSAFSAPSSLPEVTSAPPSSRVAPIPTTAGLKERSNALEEDNQYPVTRNETRAGSQAGPSYSGKLSALVEDLKNFEATKKPEREPGATADSERVLKMAMRLGWRGFGMRGSNREPEQGVAPSEPESSAPEATLQISIFTRVSRKIREKEQWLQENPGTPRASER